MGRARKGKLPQRRTFTLCARDTHLLGNLSGTARLYPIEPNVSMTLAGDGKGHITVKGLAQNTFGSGTQFNFCFEIDQTYLTKIVNSLLAADPI
jgi:hypothetical protein